MPFWSDTSRMEGQLSKLNDTMATFGSDMITIKADQNQLRQDMINARAGYQNDLDTLTKSVTDLTTEMRNNAKPRTGLWATIAIGGFGVIATLVTLQYNYTTNPILARVTNLETATHDYGDVHGAVIEARRADADSSRDRAELNRRMGEVEKQIDTLTATTQASFTRLTENLAEIETQFCAEDDMRNLTHANDLRAYAQLWEQVNKQPYNLGAVYFPRICNRKSSQTDYKDRAG